MPGNDDIVRFWSYVSKGPLCWEWIGSLSTTGYGRSWFTNRLIKAHRVSWIIANGAIPDGMCVCHSCDNRKCVRPDHLFLGTQKDNIHDKERKGRGNHPRGENAGRALITAPDVLRIRELIASGVYYHDIAPLFGIKKQTVGAIARRQSWRHI